MMRDNFIVKIKLRNRMHVLNAQNLARGKARSGEKLARIGAAIEARIGKASFRVFRLISSRREAIRFRKALESRTKDEGPLTFDVGWSEENALVILRIAGEIETFRCCSRFEIVRSALRTFTCERHT